MDQVNQGLGQCPTDSVLHEFRALVLFAKGDYQQSAATIHSVLAVGPGWNWTTMSSLYTDPQLYTNQLRALESFTKSNPQDGAARFLLAYHYLVDGFPDSAQAQLKKVVQLVPNDKVAADMSRMLAQASGPPASNGQASNGQPASGQAASGQFPTPQPPPTQPGVPASDNTNAPSPTKPTVNPIDVAALPGVWHATRPDGGKFDLTFAKDSTFTWKFTLNDKPEQFSGKYTIDGNVMALERTEGGSLVAGVVPEGDGKLNFKLLGAPPEDPGLDFTK